MRRENAPLGPQESEIGMRWTRFFIPTTKETPKDATAASHVLMLRAGLIRQLAAGVYSYLPLGYRSLRKVEQIIREEMNRAGAIELHLPVLHPLHLWDESGRTQVMGDTLLRLAGLEGDWRSQTVLGPTHEEVVTDIVRAYVSSYKQLPLNLYQIQTKFRGEARPKSGVLRTREFQMKDAYSFDADKAGLDVSYQKMYDAYCRIFSRCGLPYIAVEADSGPIGGDASHEFMVLTNAGEDIVALSENNDYAANTERATAFFDGGVGSLAVPPAWGGTGVPPVSALSHRQASGQTPVPPDAPLPDAAAIPSGTPRHPAGPVAPGPTVQQVHTPGAGRVEDVCAVLGTQPAQMIKTLIYTAAAQKGRTAAGAAGQAAGAAESATIRVVVLVRGDHEINEIKLNKVAGGACELADPRTIEELTGAAVGFAGPQGLYERLSAGDKLLIDRDVTTMVNAASGANRTDYHVTGVQPGRDFPLATPAGGKATVAVADLRRVVDGDLSPTGSGSPLRLRKAIEVGHVFKLGTKYSDAMKATFLTHEGKPQALVMGCYGIGLNRIMAAAIESHHDEGGINWPVSIAPFEALVLALDPRDADVMRVAGEVYEKLAAAGVDVLLDDRDERAGFKFKDADLIGIPWRVIVGKKALAQGVVEVDRRGGPERRRLAPQAAVAAVEAAVREEHAALRQPPEGDLR